MIGARRATKASYALTATGREGLLIGVNAKRKGKTMSKRYYEITKREIYSVLAEGEEEALAMVADTDNASASQVDYEVTWVGGKVDE